MTGSVQTGPFDPLRAQLTAAAEALSDGPDALAGILRGILDDVERALAEPLEIFPVCHHSPASGLAMVRRLRDKQPKVIYLELCEDLRPILDELRNCQLPVAVQAFASEVDGFPKDWAPLSVVAPITAASAEYQAIAYALDTPGVELILVDRSTDHVYQWLPRQSAPSKVDTAEESKAELHGDAVGLEIGDLRPRFAELEECLLRHGRVRHWSEWWDQYVEGPLADADYDTYRQVLVLIGSLFRRLRPPADTRDEGDEDRERYMWTRMREHLTASGADVKDCLYVCGSFHAASRVAEFGIDGTDAYRIAPRTATTWRYGLIPSSHAAIEAQFGLAGGSVSIAAASWTKSLARTNLAPFVLAGQRGAAKKPAKAAKAVKAGKAAKAVAPTATPPSGDRLSGFLARPPTVDSFDEAELLGWCVEIVRLARRNGYLASTADSIAIFETSILLAGMRNRARPTPYDFADAAVTCLEKDAVPGRRDVRRLCDILLGGDRIGTVGYDALPPLAQDVYDRLRPLHPKLDARTIQRVLIDLKASPELRPASDLLWVLRYLMPRAAVRPIMGERRLGVEAIQESWDLDIGRHQRALIELGYEGVTVEQVLEVRLRKAVWDPQASAATALAAVEDSILLLGSRRFTDELGARAVSLLATERTVDDAPEVLRRIRRLLAHYRATEPTLPGWVQSFVTTGYAHYCTLLPTAFTDDEVPVRQVAAMLGFLISLESVALSLGCDRTQLELAVRQSHPQAPAKAALLWAVEHSLGTLSLSSLRARARDLLTNPMVIDSFPLYLSGFVQALEPVPTLSSFVVEVMSQAFGDLPDTVLLPWLPRLITTLREHAGELVPVLVREAGRAFPRTLPALDSWTPPWLTPPAPTRPPAPSSSAAGLSLLPAHPRSVDAMAALLGLDPTWPDVTPDVPSSAAAGFVARHPRTAQALAAL
jgi:hypothetical protein